MNFEGIVPPSALPETNSILAAPGGQLQLDDETFNEIYGHKRQVDEAELVAFVNEFFEEQRPAMWERFHRWSYHIRFAAGDQWLISLDGRTWFEPPAPSGAVRVTNNLTWRAGEYRISKLTESRPTGKVIPHSNEVVDADRSEAAQQLVQHQQRAIDMDSAYDEALWYDYLCGCAFVYIGYETDSGEFIAAKKSRMVVGEDGMPTEETFFVDVDGNEVEEDVAFMYRTGDVSREVIPPWAIYVSDPTQTALQKQFRMGWETAAEVKDLKRWYGDKAKDISGGAQFDQFVYYEEMVAGWSTDGSRPAQRSRPNAERAIVRQLFERPSKEFRSGRHIVVSGSTLLHYAEELPFGNEKIGWDFPIEQVRTVFKPKDFYGKEAVGDLIKVQKRINQLESHCIEYIRLFTRGSLAAEYGTMFESTLTDEWGAIMYYTGDRPTPIQWPSLPNDVLQALTRAYENFDRISGWGDVARGDVPPGVKAARAILELKRSNDTPLGKSLQRLDRSVERINEQIIKRAIWGYTEPHWINILGADVPHMVRAVSADDFPTKFSFKIESDSMLRMSYPAKLELLFELGDRQWIDKDSAMRLLNFSDWEHRSGQWNRDYARTRMKIEQLLEGNPVGVEWWEDDAVAMLALGDRLKDPRYELLQPWQKEALTSLWVEHYKNWTMKQQGQLPPQLQQAMMQPGAPNPSLANQQANSAAALPAGRGQDLSAMQNRAPEGSDVPQQEANVQY